MYRFAIHARNCSLCILWLCKLHKANPFALSSRIFQDPGSFHLAKFLQQLGFMVAAKTGCQALDQRTMQAAKSMKLLGSYSGAKVTLGFSAALLQSNLKSCKQG